MCSRSAGVSCGLDGSTTGSHGATPLGDLATIVATYDATQGYSSNSLASYFHDVGHRDRLHDLVQDPDWLGRDGISIKEKLIMNISI